MKRVSLILAVLGVLAVWPAAAGAATFKGTVVAKERGKLLVVSPGGGLQAVSGRAVIGSRVAVSGGSVRVIGRVHTAHIRGIVVRRVGTTMVLSSNHHLVALRHARQLASASDTTPVPGAPTTAPSNATTATPGDVVSTNVTIANGGLDEDDLETVGHAGSVVVQAQIVSVGAGTVTLLVNGTQVPVSLPAGLTLPASVVGQMVSLTLNLDDQNDDNDQADDDNNDDNGGGGGDHGGGGHDGHGGGGSDD
jgi:hypothetical protein